MTTKNDVVLEGWRTEEYVNELLKLPRKKLETKLSTLLNELLRSPRRKNADGVLFFVMEAYENFTGGQFWEDFENTKCTLCDHHQKNGEG